MIHTIAHFRVLLAIQFGKNFWSYCQDPYLKRSGGVWG